MKVVKAAMDGTDGSRSADGFLESNPELLDSGLLKLIQENGGDREQREDSTGEVADRSQADAEVELKPAATASGLAESEARRDEHGHLPNIHTQSQTTED